MVQEKNKVVIQWEGSNMNDMYADAVLTLCLQIEANPQAIKQSSLRSITQVIITYCLYHYIVPAACNTGNPESPTPTPTICKLPKWAY